MSINILYANSSELTQKEKDWIINNEVKIGVSELYPIIYMNKHNEMDGYVSDILKLIFNKYNIKHIAVNINQASIALEIKNNNIDLAPIINDTKVINDFGTYSSEILQIKRMLFLKKKQININTISDLKNKKIAVLNQLGTMHYIENEHPEIRIKRTSSINESVQMLLKDDVDGLISSPIIVQKYLEDNSVIDLKAIPNISFEPSTLYFFTDKNKTLLQSILEKGLNSISIKEEKELFDKWFLKDLANLPQIFTKEELNYLEKKSVINLCVDPDWMPYEKIENHKHIGIVSDYMKEFEKKMGVHMKLIETENWTQSLKYIENKTCDVLSLVMDMESRYGYMNFTKPYIKAPLVLVTKRNVSFISDLKTLKDKKIGIQKDFAYNKSISQNYPNLNIQDVNHLREGLKKVERGELFGQVTTHLNIAYAFQEEFYGSLQISGKFDEEMHLSVGVRNDDIHLLNIFEKLLNSVSEETKQKIIGKSISLQYEESIDSKFFWSIIAFLILVLLLVLYIYLIQRKYLNKLKRVKKEIEVLNSSLEKKVQKRTIELELTNKKLVLKTLELEELNSNLDIKIKEEIDNRKKQEQLLIHQSKLAEMGEMISMIAHQWRQPLSALGTIVQNIHLRYSLGKLDKEYMENQRLLSNALTQKMSKTIDDFRNFFKPNKEKQTFSIKDAISKTIFLIDDSYKSNNIKIECKILDDILIYGYESELSQVLLNILTNAKDAFLENNIEDPIIIIETKQVQTHIKILISDNAGGISKSIINKIFEPYFTTKNSCNGTGLGLYMNKIIVEENMQGQISVKNLKAGVQFTIFIPIN
jgi:signal transduction histidine kinase